MAAICIKKECNVNAVDLKGMTPMHVAALRSNNKYIIDLLLYAYIYIYIYIYIAQMEQK